MARKGGGGGTKGLKEGDSNQAINMQMIARVGITPLRFENPLQFRNA